MKIWFLVTSVLILASWFAKSSWLRRMLGFFGVLMIVGVYLSWSQYEVGCGLGIGECYSEKLSAWHDWAKLAFVVISEISWVAIGLVLMLKLGRKLLMVIPKPNLWRGKE